MYSILFLSVLKPLRVCWLTIVGFGKRDFSLPIFCAVQHGTKRIQEQVYINNLK